MRKAIRDNLDAAVDALEYLVQQYPTMTMPDKVDVAARLRSVAKNAKSLDEASKDEIKADVKTQFKKKEGYVTGNDFKAIVTEVPTTRLDQQALKLEEPAVYAKYTKKCKDLRVTFESR